MQTVPIKVLVDAIPKTGRVFVQGAAMTPEAILQAMVRKFSRFNSLELMHLHTHGEASYCQSEFDGRFRVTNFFVGKNVRPYMDQKRVDYLPCFLSQVPTLLAGLKKPHTSIIHVSPPDSSGVCSLGTSVDVVRDAMRNSERVIAQINPNVPFTIGDGLINIADLEFATEVDAPLFETLPARLTETEEKIGKLISTLIEDGSTIQAGIGSIPNAALLALRNHKNLGLHTEMFSDAAMDLIRAGVINNSQKSIHSGKSVTSFVSGTKKLFEFLDKNKEVLFLSTGLVNDPSVIARNPKVVAVNSAIEVDLTGQICADSIGPKVISGVGGQVDFIRGASMSQGGKSIIAIPSTTKAGNSKIVSRLSSGAGVVTTRSEVDFIVTEYGIASLKGKTLGERAKALIGVAHPDHRELLSTELSA